MEDTGTNLETIANTLESVVSGIPAPVRKNFIKAFGQLCTAAVDVPVAWLEGRASEIRATTQARIKILESQGHAIAQNIEVPDEYLQRASVKFASKIIKEQINLDEITLNAANELSGKDIKEENIPETEISDDWLNEFESVARLKSADDMKLIFGKILAGEIYKPGTFSIRTVKLISQLDNQAAEIFQLLCSQTISLNFASEIYDARVVSFSGNAAANSLSIYGLTFDKLNILHEYGLIISDYNSWMGYNHCIIKDNRISATLCFQNKHHVLRPTDLEKYDKELKLSGVALTRSGRELLSIIPLVDATNYKAALSNYFMEKHLAMMEIEIASNS